MQLIGLKNIIKKDQSSLFKLIDSSILLNSNRHFWSPKLQLYNWEHRAFWLVSYLNNFWPNQKVTQYWFKHRQTKSINVKTLWHKTLLGKKTQNKNQSDVKVFFYQLKLAFDLITSLFDMARYGFREAGLLIATEIRNNVTDKNSPE